MNRRYARILPGLIRPACLTGVLCLLGMAAGLAGAADFKAIGSAPAVLYDAPSEKGRKMFVAPRGMPVEVVLTYGEWVKVRDVTGDLSWIQSKALGGKRSIVTTASGARIRAAADDAAPVVFTADKGVLLEMVEQSGGWVKVRHRDGQAGYVKATEAWGE